MPPIEVVRESVELRHLAELAEAVFGSPDFIEYDSMINIRPRQGNRSRSVDDPEARAAIADIVGRLVR